MLDEWSETLRHVQVPNNNIFNFRYIHSGVNIAKFSEVHTFIDVSDTEAFIKIMQTQETTFIGNNNRYSHGIYR